MGTVTINGQVFDSVGVRYKGNSSYNANQVKNPLNIKLDYIIDDQEMDGYGTLKLANGFKDPTMVREVLSYEIARKYFPASQSNYANVYINGTHLGLYTSDQSVDKYFMMTHFGSDENPSFKGEITSGGPPSGGVWLYYGPDSSNYYSYYEMRSDYGWAELINFLDTLNNHNAYVDQVLNIDRHLWFLAFSNLLVNLDGPINNPQNHYLYKDGNGRFNPIPWDLNESFGAFTNHQTLGNLGPLQLQQFSPFANLNQSNYPVISKILTNNVYRKMYVAHMITILEENFANGQYENRALAIQNIIDADIQADQNKLFTYSNFISNIYNQVGGGPGGGIIGIVQLMDARVNYIQSLTEFQYTAPTITNVTYQPQQVSPGDQVTFNAEVVNGVDVFFAYRSSEYGLFDKALMYDDGNHGDGSAGDNVYGLTITAYSDIQFYIYSENQDAAAFSPVRAEYEFYQIDVLSELVINEFMADNKTTVADQDGEYDDWIELYNNGTTDINLAGYYLSDDAAEPDKWEFPDTVIMAGDYLIIWADKDDTQTGLHADIKLSASGEVILLSDNNLNVLDEINFLQQKPDTTTGRYPNGTGNFIEMLPTFGAMNNNLITSVEENILSGNTSFNLENYPNPFGTSTTITFKLPRKSNVILNIYNPNGAIIETLISGYLSEGEHTYLWRADNYSKGLYFYSLNVDGHIQVRKMIVQ